MWSPIYRGRMRRPTLIEAALRRATCALLGHDEITYYGRWCKRHGDWIR